MPNLAVELFSVNEVKEKKDKKKNGFSDPERCNQVSPCFEARLDRKAPRISCLKAAGKVQSWDCLHNS